MCINLELQWKMKILSLICGVVTLYLATGQSEGKAEQKLTYGAPIRTDDIESGMENEWMEAVLQLTTQTGWAVEVKKNLDADFVKKNLLVVMYAKDDPYEDLEEIFRSDLCSLLDPNDDTYPQNHFMPREVLLGIILTGHYGSCNLKKRERGIETGGFINLDPAFNPGVKFPKKEPFQLVVNVLSSQYKDSADQNYFFQVRFTVNKKSQVIVYV